MVAVWPVLDDFDQGAEGFGAALRGYYGAVLTAAGFQPGKIHDGYGSGAAAARIVVPEGQSGLSIAQVRRQYFPADVIVSLEAKKVAGTGVALDTHMQRHGVIARAQAAVSAEVFGAGASTWSWFDGLSCYAFEARQTAPGQFKLFLLRYDAGVETILEQTGTLAGEVPEWASGHTLSLEVVTNGGGDVELTGRVGGIEAQALDDGSGGAPIAFGQMGGSGQGGGPFLADDSASAAGVIALGPLTQTGPVAPSGAHSQKRVGPTASLVGTPGGGATVDVLSSVDSSGGKLTGGGRAGFIVDDEQVVSTNRVVSVVSSFEVGSSPQATVYWRDEFGRANTELLAQFTDAFSAIGRDLTSDYSTDAGGAEPDLKLTGDAGTDSAAQGGAIDLGEAPNLPGTSAQGNGIVLSNPSLVFPPAAPASQTRVTIAVWAKLDTNRNGNELYQAGNDDESDVFGFGIRSAGGSSAFFQLRLGTGVAGAPAEYDSAPFNLTPLLGQSICYIVSYRARADGLPEGRVRFYLGRLGAATLFAELSVLASHEPGFSINGPASADAHRIGEHRTSPLPGAAADRYLDGTVDMVSVFYAELTQEQVNKVADETTSRGELIQLGCIHGLDFEDDDAAGGYHRWTPYTAGDATSNSGKWLVEDVVPLASGLVSQVDDSVVVAIHQREAANDHAQARSATFTLPAVSSRAGIALRHSGGQAAPTYYRVLVGAETPARVQIERVRDGIGAVIAREASSSPVTVAASTPFEVLFSAARTEAQDPGSNVVMTLSIDGTPIPLEVPELAAGAALDLDGNLIDTSTDRILGGPGTGVVVVTSSGQDVLVDDFLVAAVPTASGVASAPHAYLPLAAARADGDLTDAVDPDWGVTLETDPGFLIAGRFQDGRPFRRAASTYAGRIFRLNVTTSLPAETAAMRAFFDAHASDGIPFTFDPSGFVPAQGPGTFVFGESRFDDGLRGNVGAYSFTLIEIPSLGS